MAANRWHYENTDIVFPWGGTGAGNHALDNSTMSGGFSSDIIAIGFVPRAAKTLDNVRVYVTAVNGSPATTEITCALFAGNSSGDGYTSGTEIETKDIGAVAVGWQTFSGFTTALTAGQKYFLAIRNSNATPATNNVSIHYGAYCMNNFGTSHAHVSASWHTSTTGPGSLIVQSGYQAGYRIGWSDSTFVGFPISSTTATAAGYRIYGSRECGTQLTFPSTVKLPIVGLLLAMGNESGNPTGDVRFRLYNGTTLLGTTETISDAAVSYSNARHALYFSDVIQFEGTDLRMTAGVTSGGDSSNGHNAQYLTWDSDADSQALLPYDATLTFYDGSSWTQPEAGFIASALLVDWSQLPASGGLITHPGMSGGMGG